MTLKSIVTCLYPMVVLMIMLIGYSQVAHSAIEKEIYIDSRPQGAEAFILKGNKKTRIGITPLTHTLKFHSEISVIRLLLQKEGLEPVTLKIKASDDRVLADLDEQSVVLDPTVHKNPFLRRLQSSINMEIEALLLSIFKNHKHGFMLAEPARLTGKKGAVRVLLTLNDSNNTGVGMSNKGSGQSGKLKSIWSRLGPSIMMPLASKLKAADEISILSIRLKEGSKNRLKVKPVSETKTVMQCVPGYRTQQVLKFRQVPQYESYSDKYGLHTRLTGYKSESYLDTEQVYEPCHSKMPVTQIVPTTAPKYEHGESEYLEFKLKLAAYKQGLSAEQTYQYVFISRLNSNSKWESIKSGQ